MFLGAGTAEARHRCFGRTRTVDIACADGVVSPAPDVQAPFCAVDLSWDGTGPCSPAAASGEAMVASVAAASYRARWMAPWVIGLTALLFGVWWWLFPT